MTINYTKYKFVFTNFQKLTKIAQKNPLAKLELSIGLIWSYRHVMCTAVLIG